MPYFPLTALLDKKRRRHWLRKLLRYCLSTMGGILAETILLWFLATKVWADWELGKTVVAPTLGFELCLLVNYGMVRYFVWRDRKPSLWRFHVSNVSVYFVKMLFLIPVHYISGVNIVICNFIAMALAGLLNFVLNDKVVFRALKD